MSASKSNGSMVASELYAQIKARQDSDYEYLAGEAARLARAEVLELESQPILEELHLIGVVPRSLFSRFNSDSDYLAAHPILLKHIKLNYSESILRSLASSLAAKPSISYRHEFLSLFKNPPKGMGTVRLTIGSAVAGTTNKKNINETIELIHNKSYGADRLSLLRALKKLRRYPDVMMEIKVASLDPDLSIEISSWELDLKS